MHFYLSKGSGFPLGPFPQHNPCIFRIGMGSTFILTRGVLTKPDSKMQTCEVGTMMVSESDVKYINHGFKAQTQQKLEVEYETNTKHHENHAPIHHNPISKGISEAKETKVSWALQPIATKPVCVQGAERIKRPAAVQV